jgi:hypothetical protein
MEGGVDLQEVGLGLQEIPPDGQSAGTCRTVREDPDSPSVLRVRREFLLVFHSLHFVSGFLVPEVHGRSVLECRTVRVRADGPQILRGRSVIKGAVLVLTPKIGSRKRLSCEPNLAEEHYSARGFPQSIRYRRQRSGVHRHSTGELFHG